MVLKFEFYTAKVLGHIVTEEKGDAEHTKAISMPGIIINESEFEEPPDKFEMVFHNSIEMEFIIIKAKYMMEPQKKEQTGIGIDIQETSYGAVTKL